MRRFSFVIASLLVTAVFAAAYWRDQNLTNALTAAGEWGIVVVIYLEFGAARRGHQLDAALAVLQEHERKDAYEARSSIMKLPSSPDGLDEGAIQQHLKEIRPAVMAFHTIGFLMKAGDLDQPLQEHIMSFIWASTWRCWMKCGAFIDYEAERRRDPKYMEYFRELYKMSEKYRRDQNFSEIPL